MGRYRAPQINEDDDDQEIIPMDWDIIPDDAEEQFMDGPYAARMSLPYDNDNDDDDDDDGDDKYYGSQIQSSALYYTTARNCQESELSHCLLEQRENRLSETKRSAAIARAVTIIVVAIVSVVLNRYAPPPPPLLNPFPFDTAVFSTDYSDDIAADYYREKHLPDQKSNMIGVTQHETWASYSRHLTYLVYHVMAYVPSVAWYALSNSFEYAWEEIRETYFDCWRGNNTNENLPRICRGMEDLILSIFSIWSHVKQFIKMGEGSLNITTDGNNRKEDSIKLHEVSERHFCHSARCAVTRCDDTTNFESNLADSWSTEDYLRQTIGTSLPPQNMALKIIAERIDTWGLLAQVSTTTSVGSSDDEDALSRLILPPAIGFLLVGPEGVGKMRIARQLANYLLRGHCSDDASLSRGVLELFVSPEVERAHSTKELIVNHIRSREGLGSVIIIHHIESMPEHLVADISLIISGKYHSLSYETPNNLVVASCDGTVFIMTSRRWGARSIFQVIKQNGGLNRLRSESLINTIHGEVEDARLDYLSKLVIHATIAPVLPFQQEDLSSILHGSIQTVNLKYQGIRWKRLEVSLAAIRYFVGSDHVKYSELFNNDVQAEMDENEMTRFAASSYTYSTRGAHALDRNALLEAVQSLSITGPNSILKIGFDDFRKEATFRLCNSDNGLESCEVEWRSFLAYS